MPKKNKRPDFVDYLVAFTDDVGIFQHSKYGVPDRNHGYTTDDNARALILAVMLYEEYRERKYLDLVRTYLAFVYHALNDNGMFRNFMSYQRSFLEEQGSEDCFGRCIWALCRTESSKKIPINIRNTCTCILKETEKNIESVRSPRAKAYTMIGLGFRNTKTGNEEHMEKLATFLVEKFQKSQETEWNWFEDSVTYGNALFPWALFCAYQMLDKQIYLEIAKESLAFLESIVMKPGFYQPIGCNGWLVKGKTAAAFDEQPIEACEMMFTYLEYYRITHDKKCLKNAKKCSDWYSGKNTIKKPLIDRETGGCFDGITENGINQNQGAESIVSYGMSVMKQLQF